MPKKLLLMLCLAGTLTGLTSAQTNAQSGSRPKKQSGEVKIPASAVKTDDGNYHFTDATGKKWIYRNTPFGVAKSEDKDIPLTATPFGPAKLQDKAVAAPALVEPAKDTTTVTYDEGDSVRFEQTTPFGVSKYTKKKTDLTVKERAIVTSQKSTKQ